MPTIAHITRKLVERRPFLEESLAEEIVNHSALAESLIPEIEKELKKKVKFSAVNLAIRRMSEDLEKKKIINLKFDKQTDITTKSRIVEIVLFKDKNLPEYLKKIYSLIDFRKGDFLTTTQGINELMIITNERNQEKIKKILPKRSIKRIIKKLCALSLNIPETSVEQIGLFYIVARAINWEGVNIVDIVSTYTEITILVKEEDSAKSLEALNRVIEEYS